MEESRVVTDPGIPSAAVTWLTTHVPPSAMRAQSISGATTKATILPRSCVVTRLLCYVMEGRIQDAAAKRVTTGEY